MFNSSRVEKPVKTVKTIGFIFFNSNVIIEPTSCDSDARAIVVCDTKDGYGASTGSMHRERVNFDDF